MEEFLESLMPEDIDGINDDLYQGFLTKENLERLEQVVNIIHETEIREKTILYRGFDEIGMNMVNNTSSGILFKSLEKEVALDYAEPYLAKIIYQNSHLLYMDKYWGEYEEMGIFLKREHVMLTFPFEKFEVIEDFDEENVITLRSVAQDLNEIKFQYRRFYQPEKINSLNKIVKQAKSYAKEKDYKIVINGKEIDWSSVKSVLINEFGHPDSSPYVIRLNKNNKKYIIRS